MTATQKFFIFSATAALLSCGIKGPPLPPIEEETVQKQMAAENQPASPANPVSSDTSKASTKEKKKK